MAFSGGSLGDKLATQLGNDIATSQSARVIIPVCHIYLDHMMDLLLKKNLPPEDYQKIENDRHFGFWKKLQKLKNMKRLEKDKKYYPMLSDDEYHDLETINDVRNDFVSWQSIFGGGKITGYIIDIRQFFPSRGGDVSGMMGYEVYVDLNTKTKHWELYDEFWSFE